METVYTKYLIKLYLTVISLIAIIAFGYSAFNVFNAVRPIAGTIGAIVAPTITDLFILACSIGSLVYIHMDKYKSAICIKTLSYSLMIFSIFFNNINNFKLNLYEINNITQVALNTLTVIVWIGSFELLLSFFKKTQLETLAKVKAKEEMEMKIVEEERIKQLSIVERERVREEEIKELENKLRKEELLFQSNLRKEQLIQESKIQKSKEDKLESESIPENNVSQSINQKREKVSISTTSNNRFNNRSKNIKRINNDDNLVDEISSFLKNLS